MSLAGEAERRFEARQARFAALEQDCRLERALQGDPGAVTCSFDRNLAPRGEEAGLPFLPDLTEELCRTSGPLGDYYWVLWGIWHR